MHKVVYLICRKLSLLMLLFVASCNADSTAQGEDDFLIGVDEKLKGFLYSRYDSFEISEVFEKSRDSKIFANQMLPDLGKEIVAAERREFYFKASEEGSFNHLGVAVVNYASAVDAEAALNDLETKGFFSNTKILTRYVIKVNGTNHYVLYTESSANKDVLAFIEGVDI